MKYLILGLIGFALVLMFFLAMASAADLTTANTIEEKNLTIVVSALNSIAEGRLYIGNDNLPLSVDASFAPQGKDEKDEVFLSRVSASILSNLVLLSQKVEDKKTIDEYLRAMPKPIREKIDYVK